MTAAALAAALILLANPGAGDGMEARHTTIVDFNRSDPSDWRAVNDVVMGGVSSSDLLRNENGVGVFSGELSLENNGGFASVRTAFDSLDLSAAEGLEIRVRGDGKRYRLRLRCDGRFDGVAYQVAFTTDGAGWQTLRFPFADFQPTYRGRRVRDADPLATDAIGQLGLMIADRQSGSFRIEVDWVRSYGAGTGD